MNAAPHWFPSPLMPQPWLPITPARRGALPLTLPMSTPSRSGVALMRFVARPPVDPCWRLPTSYSYQGCLYAFWWLVLSFLSYTGPAKQGESTECWGACVCGCRDAAEPTVRAPLFFRNADVWSGFGGAVPPFDLPTLPSGGNNRSSLIVGRVSKDQW